MQISYVPGNECAGAKSRGNICRNQSFSPTSGKGIFSSWTGFPGLGAAGKKFNSGEAPENLEEFQEHRNESDQRAVPLAISFLFGVLTPETGGEESPHVFPVCLQPAPEQEGGSIVSLPAMEPLELTDADIQKANLTGSGILEGTETGLQSEEPLTSGKGKESERMAYGKSIRTGSSPEKGFIPPQQEETSGSKARDVTAAALPREAQSAGSPGRAEKVSGAAPPLMPGSIPDTIQSGLSDSPQESSLGVPIKEEDMIGQLVQKMEISRHLERSELKVQLKPEHLGEVTIILVKEGEILKARLVAESLQVKEALQAGLPQLRERLESQNVKVVEFHVEVDKQESGFHSDGGSQSSSQYAEKTAQEGRRTGVTKIGQDSNEFTGGREGNASGYTTRLDCLV